MGKTGSELPCTNPLTEQHICVLVQEAVARLRTFSTISIFPDLCPTLFGTRVRADSARMLAIPGQVFITRRLSTTVI